MSCQRPSATPVTNWPCPAFGDNMDFTTMVGEVTRTQVTAPGPMVTLIQSL
jgi:hypothetical protein